MYIVFAEGCKPRATGRESRLATRCRDDRKIVTEGVARLPREPGDVRLVGTPGRLI